MGYFLRKQFSAPGTSRNGNTSHLQKKIMQEEEERPFLGTCVVALNVLQFSGTLQSCLQLGHYWWPEEQAITQTKSSPVHLLNHGCIKTNRCAQDRVGQQICCHITISVCEVASCIPSTISTKDKLLRRWHPVQRPWSQTKERIYSHLMLDMCKLLRAELDCLPSLV